MSTKSKKRAEKRAKQFSEGHLPVSQERAAGAVVTALLDAMTFGILELDASPESRRH